MPRPYFQILETEFFANLRRSLRLFTKTLISASETKLIKVSFSGEFDRYNRLSLLHLAKR
jgi:hypothetical protein